MLLEPTARPLKKKILHDYSFTVFERHLLEEGKILDLSDPPVSLDELESTIKDFSFIKIKAKAVFNDVEKITELFSEFNTIGEAIAHMGAFEQINQLKTELEDLKKQVKDKERKSKLQSEYKRLTNVSKLAKEQGLYQDPKFLENLTLLTRYGFSDQFEVQQHSGQAIFTSCLKREFLREKEDLLVKKYSRKTEKEIVVFGLISQAFYGVEPEMNEAIEFSNMKAGLMNLVEHLANVENSISGKQDNEVIIDPIAVYFEV
jgi:chaperonin cofactor prefoldin